MRYEQSEFVFQSTHPHGVRQKYNKEVNDFVEFQSTHPHGVRQSICLFFTPKDSFNPRTHTGCDINASFA